MDQIDARDVVDVEFKKQPSETSVRYSLAINEWTERNFKIAVNFENPKSISKGAKRDQFKLQVKNPNYFISKLTGNPIRLDFAAF